VIADERQYRRSTVSTRIRSGVGTYGPAPASRLDEMARQGNRPGVSRKACRLRRFKPSYAIGQPNTIGGKFEACLNAIPQFVTEIDGLDIQFIHVRSSHEGAIPMILTHGWSGSIVELLKVIDPLTRPTAYGASA